ncbi:hypothetical protein [Roseibium sp. SCP14]|uniref:hypothetical protein n=1 Tax=Roseibium sp. SCP14 TaxID=3141375 RepID=UPI0033363E5C
MFRIVRRSVFVLALFGLGACQYAGETVSVDQIEDVGPPLNTEVIGSGNTTLALVLPFMGSDTVTAKQIRNGAVLAHENLSDGKLKLAIVNARSPNYSELKNTTLVALYAPDSGVSSPPPGRAVNVSLGDKPLVKNGLSLVADDMDSLAAGLQYASPSGAPVVILAPESQSDKDLESLAKNVGGTVEIIKYAKDAKANVLAKSIEDVGDITAVGFVESNQKVADIASALKRGKSKPLIVGHTGWGQSLVKNPKLQGAIIARPDSSSWGFVTERYQKQFGANPTEMSLYGFDIVAVAASLVRQHGSKAITRQRLLDSKGFKGATGAFRFNKDGTVERLYEITKIDAGKLTVMKRAPAGF